MMTFLSPALLVLLGVFYASRAAKRRDEWWTPRAGEIAARVAWACVFAADAQLLSALTRGAVVPWGQLVFLGAAVPGFCVYMSHTGSVPRSEAWSHVIRVVLGNVVGATWWLFRTVPKKRFGGWMLGLLFALAGPPLILPWLPKNTSVQFFAVMLAGLASLAVIAAALYFVHRVERCYYAKPKAASSQ